MTPCAAEILMHYYYTAEPHPNIKYTGFQDAVVWLLDERLLAEKQNHFKYEVTPKGVAWIEYILKIPLPEPGWITKCPST